MQKMHIIAVKQQKKKTEKENRVTARNEMKKKGKECIIRLYYMQYLYQKDINHSGHHHINKHLNGTEM